MLGSNKRDVEIEDIWCDCFCICENVVFVRRRSILSFSISFTYLVHLTHTDYWIRYCLRYGIRHWMLTTLLNTLRNTSLNADYVTECWMRRHRDSVMCCYKIQCVDVEIVFCEVTKSNDKINHQIFYSQRQTISVHFLHKIESSGNHKKSCQKQKQNKTKKRLNTNN